MANGEDLWEVNLKKEYIPGKQSIVIVVFVEYDVIAFDSKEGKCMLQMRKEWM